MKRCWHHSIFGVHRYVEKAFGRETSTYFGCSDQLQIQVFTNEGS